MSFDRSGFLMPRLLGSDYWDTFDFPEHLANQDFGDVVSAWDVFEPMNRQFTHAWSEPATYMKSVSRQSVPQVPQYHSQQNWQQNQQYLPQQHHFDQPPLPRRRPLQQSQLYPYSNQQLMNPFNSSFFQPSRQLLNQVSQIPSSLEQQVGLSSVQNNPDQFQVGLDCRHFNPSEVTIEHGDNNSIIIHGRHEERGDEHGFVTREFTRRYVLPRECDVDKVQANWNENGQLVVSCIKNKQIKDESGASRRSIPIKGGEFYQRNQNQWRSIQQPQQQASAQYSSASQVPTPQPSLSSQQSNISQAGSVQQSSDAASHVSQSASRPLYSQSGEHQSSFSSGQVDQSSPNVVTASTGTHPTAAVSSDLDKNVETKQRTHHVEKKTAIRG